VALFTAALDERVAAVVAASAVDSLRNPSPHSEGIAHYTDLHGLLPRLSQFKGNEKEIPADYDDVLKAIAPRPVYLRAPLLDWTADVEQVRRLSASAGTHVSLATPRDFNRFRADAQREAFAWLAGLAR
jgi:hypothetical protein